MLLTVSCSLRDNIGVVPQEPMLFNDSIMNNIRYARLTASNEEIHNACRAAALHDKIMTFPDRESTLYLQGPSCSYNILQATIQRLVIVACTLYLVVEINMPLTNIQEVIWRRKAAYSNC